MLSDHLRGLVGAPTGGPGSRIRAAAANSLQPAGRLVGRLAKPVAGRRGAAATEMAMVLPVFIMLILGMFELGRALMIKQSLTYAAQEGCRVAILDGSTLASVRTKATDSLQPMGIAATSVTVTTNPTAEWIARQITEAFPWDEAPKYLIRDRDASYGHAVTRRLAAMGIRDHPTAPRSFWQNGHAERLIGSIRRECLDHIVVFGEAHLRRILAAYAGYYNEVRTHLSLSKDSPGHRSVQRYGQVVTRSILGGLHHQYCRM